MSLTEPAAFEIRKRELPLLFLSEREVEAVLDPLALLDALAEGFADLENGAVQLPARPEVTIPGLGFSLAMPAWRPGDHIAVKVVNVFEHNLALGLPNHLAIITLFDPANGAATCVLDGTYITGVRTAAAAVLSVRLLARADARVATVVGAGVQAREHLRLLPMVRSLERINVCSLVHDEAVRLAATSSLAVARDDVAAAVGQSDIVCLATHSASPVIDAAWVRAGTHVTSVGYFPPDGEMPRDLLDISRLFVESHDAFCAAPVGCAELDHADPAGATTLGQVVIDADRGRRFGDEITVYKAMGIALEDLVAANLAHRAAKAAGQGTLVMW
jgi:alanine dehydrogenase